MAEATERYQTTLHQTGNNTGVPVPSEVLERLGGGRRAAVRATVNGYAFRGTVGSMGGQALISFSADKRRESGLSGGDPITVELALDTEPRTSEVPADLAEALEAAGVREEFDRLSPSRRKAHVAAVEGAKAEATRARRVAAVVAALD